VISLLFLAVAFSAGGWSPASGVVLTPGEGAFVYPQSADA